MIEADRVDYGGEIHHFLLHKIEKENYLSSVKELIYVDDSRKILYQILHRRKQRYKQYSEASLRAAERVCINLILL